MTEPVAPAVHTRPADAVQADAAAEKQEFESRPLSNPEKKKMLVEQIRALEALEAREVLGARDLTPKQRLMDSTKLEDKHPDKHFRWVNVHNDAKAEQRRAEGYVAVDEEMAKDTGCRTRLGSEMVLMSIPKHVRDARIRRQDELTARRQGTASEGEMREMAERVAEDVSRRTGRNIPVERILVSLGR